MKIKAKYHYGSIRHERYMTFSEFLQAMQEALNEIPGNAGREHAVYDCIHGLIIDGKGEFGWFTYSNEA